MMLHRETFVSFNLRDVAHLKIINYKKRIAALHKNTIRESLVVIEHASQINLLQ